MDSKLGTALGPTDALFTGHQEAMLAALGCARQSKPNIDLPCICRFDAPRSQFFVSDGTKDGELYGAVLVEGEKPRVGYFSRSELTVLKRAGRLRRTDLMDDVLTVHEVGRIATMRFQEAQSVSLAGATDQSKRRMNALAL
ncbi:MAG TPA: hypothetical protein VGN79_12525 [Devosia sp.]|jgi:hypothetical protein|nr:hypothetical protein [Devosia sp.]